MHELEQKTVHLPRDGLMSSGPSMRTGKALRVC